MGSAMLSLFSPCLSQSVKSDDADGRYHDSPWIVSISSFSISVNCSPSSPLKDFEGFIMLVI